MPPNGLPSEKYNLYSGVLQVWISQTVQDTMGNAAGWLNAQANEFEKKHPGIYIRVNSVPPESLRKISAMAQPPDMVLFLPGETEADAILPDSAPSLIALSGYVLAASRALPADLTQLPDGSLGFSPGMELIWTSLCEKFTGSPEKAGAQSPDIGLLNCSTPLPTAMPDTGSALNINILQNSSSEELFSELLKGKIAAMPVSLRQARRILRMQAEGKIENITFLNGAEVSDRALYAACIRTHRDDASERAVLCRELIEYILEETPQTALKRFDLISPDPTVCLYSDIPGLQETESALHRPERLLPEAFSELPNPDFSALLSGTRSAREIMRGLRNDWYLH